MSSPPPREARGGAPGGGAAGGGAAGAAGGAAAIAALLAEQRGTTERLASLSNEMSADGMTTLPQTMRLQLSIAQRLWLLTSNADERQLEQVAQALAGVAAVP